MRQVSPIMGSGCPGFTRARVLTRREMLRAGGLSLFGLSLADVLAASQAQGESTGSFGRAKACIVLFMWGGPSQLDTWDPKPDAPAEVRGEFRPIATRIPGTRISEHLPLLAQHAEKYAIIRSMTHDDPAHLSSVHHILTGRHAPKVKSDADPPSRRDSPHIGSVLAHLRPTKQALPSFVTVPWTVSHPAAPGGLAPGQNAGWLGQAYDPFVVTGDPNSASFRVSGLNLSADVTMQRFETREHLLAELDDFRTGAPVYSAFQKRALALISSAATRRAFALEQEPDRMRERYGRNTHGQSLLLARRLIEAGARLVQVNWHQDHHNFWDTHGDNFNRLKRDLMPPADQGFSALLEDLKLRGMLDETLIVWVGEFGRKPQITRGNAGREHHPWCYSAVLAGGGVVGGQVYGRSDAIAAYPSDYPVSPAYLAATVYHALGIAPATLLEDREGRRVSLTEGAPILSLFA
jgi:uncharacterized protein (DUF1501 family)